MKIAFDCRIIRDKNPAGISRVVLELLKKVLSCDKKNEYYLIFDSEEMKDFVSYYFRNIKKSVKILIVPYGILTPQNLIYFPGILKEREIDIYYAPYYFCSPFVNKRIKVILTVFDLMHFLFPYFKMSFTRKMYHRVKLASKVVFRRADRIVTISVNTSRDLVRNFKISPRKVRMIYMGVSDNFRVIKKELAIRFMEEKFSLRNYILFVGRNEPHKNLKSLILAYNYLPANLKQKYKLLLVGKEDERYKPELRYLVQRLGLESNVIFAGYVDDAELPYIYSGASLFVLPSLYEGFGIPILEAMACGIPVTCSNSSSLPEVGSDAAIYFNPRDYRDISEKMEKVLTDNILRYSLIEKGLLQVKNFTWFNAANSLLECFNEFKK